jgi:glycosyltransferase involved in cell wall biosynthesis
MKCACERTLAGGSPALLGEKGTIVMSNHIPKVSIGLPVYNGAKYLPSAIHSLLTQTFEDFELIISDNASTDGTAEICQWYAKRDSRIRYHREEKNRGAAWNFTRTFELARGEYFKWQAHDDLCETTFLEKCVAVLDADPSVVLCHTRSAVIDCLGNLAPEDPASWRRTGEGVILPPVGDALTVRELDAATPAVRYAGVLLKTIWCFEMFGVVRRSVMQQTGKLRAYRAAEKVFLAELSLRGRFHEVPEVLFLSRRHADQFSLMATTAQHQWVKPGQKKLRLPIPRQVRPTIGHLMLLPAAPIGWGQRVRCFGGWLQYVFQIGKWKRIALCTLRGTGISDGLLEAPESKKTPAKRSVGAVSTDSSAPQRELASSVGSMR